MNIKVNDKIITKYGVLTVKSIHAGALLLIDTKEGYLMRDEEVLEVVREVEETTKEFVAICKYDGATEIVRAEYPTKTAFKKDLKLNGYKIVYSYIFTAEEYELFINEDREFIEEFENRIIKKRIKSRVKSRMRRRRKETAGLCA